MELKSFQETNEGITAEFSGTDKTDQVEFLYVCGCDGADSVVRNQIQAGFQGGTYEERFEENCRETSVLLDFETEFINRPEDMVAVKRGPLLYSIAIKDEWKMIDYGKEENLRVFPHCDYEVFPQSQWNYGYVDKNIQYKFNGIGKFPFNAEEAPIEATANVVEINWPKENGIVTRVPADRKPLSSVKKVKLLPYGCTNLRITEIPFIEDE
ncbi:FAD-dependent monooxygenase [Bacillus sp. SD088]|uniref:FAD-dependent monooxygenase n=1 Tax=Bacillus sp. SD088 TaxID=2782012 RepID=UPI001A979AEC|nr:FAD-dependent monooxygenase [Bacillus sp. SD088]MBO0993172.1 FAD-dependent monooxygenase [Bacillus sp. SD088]